MTDVAIDSDELVTVINEVLPALPDTVDQIRLRFWNQGLGQEDYVTFARCDDDVKWTVATVE